MTKKISAIWAQDKNGLIGKSGKLPWSLPADLEHFKQTTIGHGIVMGRVTFDGMRQRALPNRLSIVLTSDETYQIDSDRVLIVHSLQEVLDWYAKQDKKLFIIGGSQLFTAFEPYIEELIITDIEGQFEGDIYFPADFPMEKFTIKNSHFHSKDEVNHFDFTIKTYERREW